MNLIETSLMLKILPKTLEDFAEKSATSKHSRHTSKRMPLLGRMTQS